MVENLKKQMEMRKVEGRKLGSEAWVGSNLDYHWYSVESGLLFAAAGANERIGKDLAGWEGPISPAEDSSSPPWEDPEGMGRVPCWPLSFAPLPAHPDRQRRMGSRGQGPASGSGLGTSLQASCLRQPVAVKGPGGAQ